MSGARIEFRVTWKRAGCRAKSRVYSRKSSAERFIYLFGEEPWRYYGGNPDALQCCSGYECACRGLTVRQAAAEDRARMPPLEYIRLETRQVGEWAPFKEES